MLAGKGTADRESLSLPLTFEMNNGSNRWKILAFRRNHGSAQIFQGNVEVTRQSLRSTTAVRHVFLKGRKCAARPNHGLKQPAGSRPSPKFKAIGDDVLASKMTRKRTHDVLQRLAHENDVGTALDQLLNLPDSTLFQPGLQLVLEEFFAEQIKTVPGHAAQHGMHHARGKFAVRGIQEGTQQSHQKDEPATPKAFRERLGVPGKERNGPDHGQVEKAALDAPVDGGGRTGIVVCLIQS